MSVSHRANGGAPSLPAVESQGLQTPEPLIIYPGLVRPAFSVTVIGDIRIDVVSTLRTRRFAQLTHDHHEANGVAVAVGGTAMNFARAAAPHFVQVRVIAAIGDDQWSDIIGRAADEIGVHVGLEQHPGVPNGLVMIVRDAGTPDSPGGIRLMLAQKPSPYDLLDVRLIRRHQNIITTSDALVIDGYAVLHDRSAAAVDLATEIALSAGVPVSFDLVPHTIDQQLPARRIEPFLRRASMNIAEAPTLARLFHLPQPPETSHEYLAELVERIPRRHDGSGQTNFVRYGYGVMEKAAAFERDQSPVHYHTGYARQADGSGYGYRVAAAELKWWLATHPQPSPILRTDDHTTPENTPTTRASRAHMPCRSRQSRPGRYPR